MLFLRLLLVVVVGGRVIHGSSSFLGSLGGFGFLSILHGLDLHRHGHAALGGCIDTAEHDGSNEE